MSRIFGNLVGLALVLLASATSALGEEKTIEPTVANGVEPVVVDEPAFPAPLPKDRVRVWAGSYFVPPTDFNGVDLGLARPEARIRVRVPLADVVNVQVSADFRANLYNTDGSGGLFADCTDCPAPRELYSATLVAQGGLLLNRDWHLFRADEQWAALGSVYGRARWEPGAFEESLSPGLLLGIGYQLPGKLRIAVAGRLERALDGDGVKVAPSGHLRWDIVPKVRLRNRGLGLQLEYRPTTRVGLFVTGFQTSDRFRLDDRPGLSSAPTFRDRQVLVGGGLMFKLAHAFRLTAEAGAIVDRRIYLDTRDDGTIDSTRGDTSPYFAIRAEIRP